MQSSQLSILAFFGGCGDPLQKSESFLDHAPFAPRRASAVALEVEDTGPGISPEVQERLFDPFFTTKEAGTGLGLTIAERIVHRHGGALQFRTQMQRGTTFSVILLSPENDEPSP